MLMLDYREIEKKWQKVWDDAKVYEPEPNDKRGAMVINAFPYVNAPLHIGHFRSYGTAETYSRYLRMKGFNVLFPFGFHATGTPITSFARRIANKDQDLIDELEKIYNIPHEAVVKMDDPAYIASYMIERQEQILRLTGLGIDWRRRFTTVDPLFSKMVEWQFHKLHEKGYLVKGTHPVAWCPAENHAVGENDTKGDVHPDLEEMVVIKFKDADSDASFLCLTYRPETIYGVTNLFVKEDIRYLLVEIKGSKYYISSDAADILKFQLNIKTLGEAQAAELLGKKAVNPITGETVPILPGYFVKSDVGTGVVMSVPSHAPFDYVALERLKSGGYPVPAFEYRKLLSMEGGRMGATAGEGEASGRIEHPEIPALAYLELLNLKPDAVDDQIERVTKLVYREEARYGVMLVGQYKGRKEPEARELIKKDMVKSGAALLVYEITNDEPVFCRDGTRIVVNVVSDQWFINYGDGKWKDSVRKEFANTKIFPENFKQTFDHAIGWIDLRAAERAHGLGTRFPYNKEHIIESLSDSTIYMVFYTFVHILRAAKVAPEQLKKEFFDYVLLGKGDAHGIAKDLEMDVTVLKRCRESFEYWYGWTSSHSATEHIYNHFTMYLFNHAAILPEKYFPKQIAVNGMLLYEGEKMSKSRGNIVPLDEGVERFGADALKFVDVTGSELESVSDFSPALAGSIASRNDYIARLVERLQAMNGTELEGIDYLLYSKLNSKIKKATGHMDRLEFRNAYTEIYYNSAAELDYYIARGGKNQVVFRDFLEKMVLMLSPTMPHFTEEMWHRLGNQTLVVQERWPTSEESMINEKVEAIEDIVAGTADDITQTTALSSKIDANKGKKVKSIKIIIADEWKRKAYNMLLERREMPKVLEDPSLADIGKEKLSKFLVQFMKKLNALMPAPEIESSDIYSSFLGAREYLKQKFGAEVIVERESASASQRAGRALPGKPSIEIVWG